MGDRIPDKILKEIFPEKLNRSLASEKVWAEEKNSFRGQNRSTQEQSKVKMNNLFEEVNIWVEDRLW